MYLQLFISNEFNSESSEPANHWRERINTIPRNNPANAIDFVWVFIKNRHLHYVKGRVDPPPRFGLGIGANSSLVIISIFYIISEGFLKIPKFYAFGFYPYVGAYSVQIFTEPIISELLPKARTQLFVLLKYSITRVNRGTQFCNLPPVKNKNWECM